VSSKRAVRRKGVRGKSATTRAPAATDRRPRRYRWAVLDARLPLPDCAGWHIATPPHATATPARAAQHERRRTA